MSCKAYRATELCVMPSLKLFASFNWQHSASHALSSDKFHAVAYKTKETLTSPLQRNPSYRLWDMEPMILDAVSRQEGSSHYEDDVLEAFKSGVAPSCRIYKRYTTMSILSIIILSAFLSVECYRVTV